MAADIILDGEALQLQGKVIATDSEVTSKGGLAGFAFHDRTSPKNRYVWYAYSNKVRLYKDGVGDVLTIEDKKIEIDTIVGSQSEITSKGGVAGFAFHDRGDQKNRYVLYANGNKVRLWKDGVGDVFTIDENGLLDIPKIVSGAVTFLGVKTVGITAKSVGTDTLTAKDITTGKLVVKNQETEMDLLKTIKELQNRIAKLEAASKKG